MIKGDGKERKEGRELGTSKIRISIIWEILGGVYTVGLALRSYGVGCDGGLRMIRE